MAGSFNRITLVGNLVRDPEIKYVNSGAAVTKFTLAVNRRNKNSEEVDFIDCVAWEKLAETVNTYAKKGASMLVDGRLSIRSYETKEGEKRKAAEVVVNVMQLLNRKPAGSNSSTNGHAEATASHEETASNSEYLEEIPF
jgi:single-strand DNA-binding protein